MTLNNIAWALSRVPSLKRAEDKLLLLMMAMKAGQRGKVSMNFAVLCGETGLKQWEIVGSLKRLSENHLILIMQDNSILLRPGDKA